VQFMLPSSLGTNLGSYSLHVSVLTLSEETTEAQALEALLDALAPFGLVISCPLFGPVKPRGWCYEVN